MRFKFMQITKTFPELRVEHSPEKDLVFLRIEFKLKRFDFDS